MKNNLIKYKRPRCNGESTVDYGETFQCEKCILELYKEDMERYFRRIRENNLLIFAILIGIIGSLIAGVINDLIKESTFYPWAYLLILITILLILILKLLSSYIGWRVWLYGANKWMKESKKVQAMVDAHRKKYPIKKKISSLMINPYRKN